mgnify:CR=1 FL=1
MNSLPQPTETEHLRTAFATAGIRLEQVWEYAPLLWAHDGVRGRKMLVSTTVATRGELIDLLECVQAGAARLISDARVEVGA